MNTIRYVIILFACIPFSSHAQSWCPPGATWTHGIMAFYIEGYLQTTYIGDTILDGRVGQKLEMVAIEYNHLTDMVVITDDPSPTITSYGDGIISIWSDAEQTWDTLYWMSAVPGQSWRVAHSDNECDPADHILVTDTGSIVLDGVSLRYLDLVSVYDVNEFPVGRVLERLGWLHWMTLFPGCFAVDGPGGLRCYSDDEMSYNSPTWNYGCNSIADIVEGNGSSKTHPFPNPGTDHFSLQIPPGMHHLTLFDAQGRQVLSQHLSEERSVISTTTLPSGIYHIHITDSRGRNTGHRWIKE